MCDIGAMPHIPSPIRWSDVIEKKPATTLPFLRFYRDAGLIPDPSAEGGAPVPPRRRGPAL